MEGCISSGDIIHAFGGGNGKSAADAQMVGEEKEPVKIHQRCQNRVAEQTKRFGHRGFAATGSFNGGRLSGSLAAGDRLRQWAGGSSGTGEGFLCGDGTKFRQAALGTGSRGHGKPLHIQIGRLDSRTQNIVWRFGKIGEKNKCKEFFKSSVFPCVPTEKRIKWKQDSKK